MEYSRIILILVYVVLLMIPIFSEFRRRYFDVKYSGYVNYRHGFRHCYHPTVIQRLFSNTVDMIFLWDYEAFSDIDVIIYWNGLEFSVIYKE